MSCCIGGSAAVASAASSGHAPTRATSLAWLNKLPATPLGGAQDARAVICRAGDSGNGKGGGPGRPRKQAPKNDPMAHKWLKLPTRNAAGFDPGRAADMSRSMQAQFLQLQQELMQTRVETIKTVQGKALQVYCKGYLLLQRMYNDEKVSALLSGQQPMRPQLPPRPQRQTDAAAWAEMVQLDALSEQRLAQQQRQQGVKHEGASQAGTTAAGGAAAGGAPESAMALVLPDMQHLLLMAGMDGPPSADAASHSAAGEQGDSRQAVSSAQLGASSKLSGVSSPTPSPSSPSMDVEAAERTKLFEALLNALTNQRPSAAAATSATPPQLSIPIFKPMCAKVADVCAVLSSCRGLLDNPNNCQQLQAGMYRLMRHVQYVPLRHGLTPDACDPRQFPVALVAVLAGAAAALYLAALDLSDQGSLDACKRVLEDIVAGVSLLEGCSPLAFLLRVQTNAQLLALEQAVAATAGRARAQALAAELEDQMGSAKGQALLAEHPVVAFDALHQLGRFHLCMANDTNTPGSSSSSGGSNRSSGSASSDGVDKQDSPADSAAADAASPSFGDSADYHLKRAALCFSSALAAFREFEDGTCDHYQEWSSKQEQRVWASYWLDLASIQPPAAGTEGTSAPSDGSGEGAAGQSSPADVSSPVQPSTLSHAPASTSDQTPQPGPSPSSGSNSGGGRSSGSLVVLSSRSHHHHHHSGGSPVSSSHSSNSHPSSAPASTSLTPPQTPSSSSSQILSSKTSISSSPSAEANVPSVPRAASKRRQGKSSRVTAASPAATPAAPPGPPLQRADKAWTMQAPGAVWLHRERIRCFVGLVQSTVGPEQEALLQASCQGLPTETATAEHVNVPSVAGDIMAHSAERSLPSTAAAVVQWVWRNYQCKEQAARAVAERELRAQLPPSRWPSTQTAAQQQGQEPGAVEAESADVRADAMATAASVDVRAGDQAAASAAQNTAAAANEPGAAAVEQAVISVTASGDVLPAGPAETIQSGQLSVLPASESLHGLPTPPSTTSLPPAALGAFTAELCDGALDVLCSTRIIEQLLMQVESAQRLQAVQAAPKPQAAPASDEQQQSAIAAGQSQPSGVSVASAETSSQHQATASSSTRSSTASPPASTIPLSNAAASLSPSNHSLSALTAACSTVDGFGVLSCGQGLRDVYLQQYVPDQEDRGKVFTRVMANTQRELFQRLAPANCLPGFNSTQGLLSKVPWGSLAAVCMLMLKQWQLRPATLKPSPYQQSSLVLASVLCDPEGPTLVGLGPSENDGQGAGAVKRLFKGWKAGSRAGALATQGPPAAAPLSSAGAAAAPAASVLPPWPWPLGAAADGALGTPPASSPAQPAQPTVDKIDAPGATGLADGTAPAAQTTAGDIAPGSGSDQLSAPADPPALPVEAPSPPPSSSPLMRQQSPRVVQLLIRPSARPIVPLAAQHVRLRAALPRLHSVYDRPAVFLSVKGVPITITLLPVLQTWFQLSVHSIVGACHLLATPSMCTMDREQPVATLVTLALQRRILAAGRLAAEVAAAAARAAREARSARSKGLIPPPSGALPLTPSPSPLPPLLSPPQFLAGAGSLPAARGSSAKAVLPASPLLDARVAAARSVMFALGTAAKVPMAPELKLELISIMSKFGDKAHIAADTFRDLVARHMHVPPQVVEAAAAQAGLSEAGAAQGAPSALAEGKLQGTAVAAGGEAGVVDAQQHPHTATDTPASGPTTRDASVQPMSVSIAPSPASAPIPPSSASVPQPAPASSASSRALVRGKAGRRTARRLKERQLGKQGMPELARPSLDHLVSGARCLVRTELRREQPQRATQVLLTVVPALVRASHGTGSGRPVTKATALLQWGIEQLLKKHHPYLALEVIKGSLAGGCCTAALVLPLVQYCCAAGSDHALAALLAALPGPASSCSPRTGSCSNGGSSISSASALPHWGPGLVPKGCPHPVTAATLDAVLEVVLAGRQHNTPTQATGLPRRARRASAAQGQAGAPAAGSGPSTAVRGGGISTWLCPAWGLAAARLGYVPDDERCLRLLSRLHSEGVLDEALALVTQGDTVVLGWQQRDGLAGTVTPPQRSPSPLEQLLWCCGSAMQAQLLRLVASRQLPAPPAAAGVVAVRSEPPSSAWHQQLASALLLTISSADFVAVEAAAAEVAAEVARGGRVMPAHTGDDGTAGVGSGAAPSPGAADADPSASSLVSIQPLVVPEGVVGAEVLGVEAAVRAPDVDTYVRYLQAEGFTEEDARGIAQALQQQQQTPPSSQPAVSKEIDMTKQVHTPDHTPPAPSSPSPSPAGPQFSDWVPNLASSSTLCRQLLLHLASQPLVPGSGLPLLLLTLHQHCKPRSGLSEAGTASAPSVSKGVALDGAQAWTAAVAGPHGSASPLQVELDTLQGRWVAAKLLLALLLCGRTAQAQQLLMVLSQHPDAGGCLESLLSATLRDRLAAAPQVTPTLRWICQLAVVAARQQAKPKPQAASAQKTGAAQGKVAMEACAVGGPAPVVTAATGLLGQQGELLASVHEGDVSAQGQVQPQHWPRRSLLIKCLIAAQQCGDPEVLQQMHEGMTVGQALEAAAIATRCGRADRDVRPLLKHIIGRHGVHSAACAPEMLVLVNALAARAHAPGGAPALRASSASAVPPDCALHVAALLVAASREPSVDLARGLTAVGKRLAISVCCALGHYRTALKLWTAWSQAHAPADAGTAIVSWLLVACAEEGAYEQGLALLPLIKAQQLVRTAAPEPQATDSPNVSVTASEAAAMAVPSTALSAPVAPGLATRAATSSEEKAVVGNTLAGGGGVEAPPELLVLQAFLCLITYAEFAPRAAVSTKTRKAAAAGGKRVVEEDVRELRIKLQDTKTMVELEGLVRHFKRRLSGELLLAAVTLFKRLWAELEGSAKSLGAGVGVPVLQRPGPGRPSTAARHAADVRRGVLLLHYLSVRCKEEGRALRADPAQKLAGPGPKPPAAALVLEPLLASAEKYLGVVVLSVAAAGVASYGSTAAARKASKQVAAGADAGVATAKVIADGSVGAGDTDAEDRSSSATGRAPVSVAATRQPPSSAKRPTPAKRGF